MSSEGNRLSKGIAGIRDAVEAQLGVKRIEGVDVDPSTLPAFREGLLEPLDAEERERRLARAEELQPWLQGPFPIGGDLVIGGAWRNDQRWIGLGENLEDLSGKRVLDIGSNAGWDPFMFALRGAAEVVGCEPYDFYEQAAFLESIYETGVKLERIGWRDLDPEKMGQFEVVHCNGVLYHELNPQAMLTRFNEMTAPGGTLILGSMMLASAELSEYARFVPDAYYGDPTWWWVPGQLALRRMIEAAGFDVTGDFGLAGGPPGEFETVNGYVAARKSERPPAFS